MFSCIVFLFASESYANALLEGYRKHCFRFYIPPEYKEYFLEILDGRTRTTVHFNDGSKRKSDIGVLGNREHSRNINLKIDGYGEHCPKMTVIGNIAVVFLGWMSLTNRGKREYCPKMAGTENMALRPITPPLYTPFKSR